MAETVRSFIAPATSFLVAYTIPPSLWSTPTAKIIIPAIIFSLIGGTVAAISPIGKDKSWGAFAGLRALFVGVAAGIFFSFIIAGTGMMNSWTAWGIEGFIAFLGQKVFDYVAKIGPGPLFARVFGVLSKLVDGAGDSTNVSKEGKEGKDDQPAPPAGVDPTDDQTPPAAPLL